MLAAKNITYRTGGKTLLNDISTTFESGKLNLIIGPNGAGKSTLIRIICSQLKPAVPGIVTYDGIPLSEISLLELARMRAVLSQNFELSFPMSVLEVVMLGRSPHYNGKPGKKDKQACDEAMEFFDVTGLSDRNFLTLSGGEKQRVQFARVMAQIWFPVTGRSRYLILDEPLTFLDVHYQFGFMEKVSLLLKQKDLLVIGVVHDLNLAARFGDNILFLNEGKVLADGNKYEVLTTENLKTAYHMDPVIYNNDRGMFFFFNP